MSCLRAVNAALSEPHESGLLRVGDGQRWETVGGSHGPAGVVSTWWSRSRLLTGPAAVFQRRPLSWACGLISADVARRPLVTDPHADVFGEHYSRSGGRVEWLRDQPGTP
jgi:hypothetical protein